MDNNQPMSDEEAKIVLGMLLANGFGISGHQVGNGADYYYCSACHTCTDTIGHSNLIGDITDVEHKDDCELTKLYNWTQQP